MIAPDLAVHAGSAIPEPRAAAVRAALGVSAHFRPLHIPALQLSTVLQLSNSLLVGLAATAIAWLALLVVVAHGRYVTESVAVGEYRKGPFHDRNPRVGSEFVDLEERERREERGGRKERDEREERDRGDERDGQEEREERDGNDE